ncbi:MAG: hypothetical protein HUK07_01990 [Bacteroidaceae bacterium]|nr:hypothetical protein [Bacteroidaceae bacterium]
MKYISLLATAIICFTSCAETLEERADREAKEFTKKNCPAPVSREVAIDSMTFSQASKTFNYYYSISPKYDTKELDIKKTEEMLLRELRIQTNLIKYKQAGFSFRYIYYALKNPKKHVIDITFKKEDYGM